MQKQALFTHVNFGQRVAEDEIESLATYFVETDAWRRVFEGKIDVIYGPKGSGKSALYSLLTAKTNELFDRNIILVAGENPRGTPAFKDLITDPPVSEQEFIGLWKLYFLTLLVSTFEDFGFGGDKSKHLQDILRREGLIKGKRSLQAVIQSVFSYIKWLCRPERIEAGIALDPNSPLPCGFSGKIVLREPTEQGHSSDIKSVDSLLSMADEVLNGHGYHAWILLDRLDVAFIDSSKLENNALRALFRVYLDLYKFDNIKVKIFLRTDIWDGIITNGFREASHITRDVKISWDKSSLLNLIVRRALHNSVLIDYYEINKDDILSSVDNQEKFFFLMFPGQVDTGPNKPSSLDWMLTRTRDGAQNNTPRELIHFLNALRDRQMHCFEVGEHEPERKTLFSRMIFKEALKDVSEVRLTQTLYAEYPALREKIEKLRDEKSSHSVDTLSRIWGTEKEETSCIAHTLVSIGFFEQRGTKESPEFWVPFLYRAALNLVQGTAE